MMPGRKESPNERLDLLLVARGLARSRAEARALVLAGRVSSGAKALDKPGTTLPRTAPLSVREGPRFVSRSGAKLEAALAHFAIEAAGRDALDVGSSTGGFTQVLLRAGAGRVIALDVGSGQLDWTLRCDPRVHVLEGQNARYLVPTQLPYRPALAAVDVSFISLTLVLPPVVDCLAQPGEIVALIKPQFEVGRGKVGRGGIVRDPELHRGVLSTVAAFIERSGWRLCGLCASPLRGAEGNREFFAHIRPWLPPRSGAEIEPEIRKALEEQSEERN